MRAGVDRRKCQLDGCVVSGTRCPRRRNNCHRAAETGGVGEGVGVVGGVAVAVAVGLAVAVADGVGLGVALGSGSVPGCSCREKT